MKKIIHRLPFVRWLFFSMASVIFTSCQNTAKPTETEEKKEPPRYLESLVGKVTSYEADTKIIIIQTLGSFKNKADDVVFSRGKEGRTGNLHLTGQGNQFFRAAELRSGDVEVGDAIFWRRANPNFKEKDKINNPTPKKPKSEQIKAP